MSAATNRNLQLRFARELEGGGDICRASAARDQRGPPVDQPVVDEARGFVAFVAGLKKRPREVPGKGLDVVSVERCRGNHSDLPVAVGLPSLKRRLEKSFR